MSAEGRAEMDDTMARALMGTSGALSKDAVVRVAGFQNRDAEAAFLQQYESSVGNLPDHSPPAIESGDDPDGGAEPEPTKPMTSIDKARALLPKILAEGQTAGGFVISLHAHDMSDKLISQMKDHQSFMNSAYRLLQNKVAKNDDSGYGQITKLVEKKWPSTITQRQIGVRCWGCRDPSISFPIFH